MSRDCPHFPWQQRLILLLISYKWSDCDETFEVGASPLSVTTRLIPTLRLQIADEELVQGSFELPGPLGDNAELLKRFSKLCHTASQTMLSSVSDALGLDDSERFEQWHRPSEGSESGLKVIYEPSLTKLADVGDNLHTDGGTFTLVFCEQWGIQAYLGEGSKWGFTAPMAGCALVNVADSLQRLSNGRLHSPKHRVTQPVDGFAKRYFVAYLLRPERALKEAWAVEG